MNLIARYLSIDFRVPGMHSRQAKTLLNQASALLTYRCSFRTWYLSKLLDSSAK